VLILLLEWKGRLLIENRYDNADHWDSFRNFLVHNK
jgi:hypothetical protein